MTQNRYSPEEVHRLVNAAVLMTRLSRIYFVLASYNDAQDDEEAHEIGQALQDIKIIAHEQLDEENLEKFMTTVHRVRDADLERD